MKKTVFILGLLILISLNSFCQTDNYEFLRQRPAGEGFTTFFDLSGLKDDFTADQIISALRADENISRADYFSLKNGKDRIHIFYNNSIDANYVRAIIQAHNVDYDLTTVLLNGELQQSKDEKIRLRNLSSNQTSINESDFPKYENTGNKDIDDNNYRVRKDTWIENNPEKYESILKEMKTNETTPTINKKEENNIN
ncbi:MAG: hypothetical protein RBR97_02065 [Bacteroidales bacterium]|nr:hypothetical protein [Bacteroidales bacterium]